MQPIKFFPFVIIAICAVFGVIEPAHAYVDPGSGSVIVTTILGVIGAIGYTLRKYLYRLKRLVTGQKADADSDLSA